MRIVVCASGEGTNFEAIVEASRRGELSAEVVGLIVNRANAGARARAEALGVPSVLLSLKTFPDRPSWDQAMAAQLEAWRADWIVLAGFLALIGPEVLRRFPGRVVNSHPALLPRHGGKGMYGRAVHEAVLASGDQESGVTIHLIDEQYDRGSILEQRRIQILPSETAESLEARVKELERKVYPKVLQDLLHRRRTSG